MIPAEALSELQIIVWKFWNYVFSMEETSGTILVHKLLNEFELFFGGCLRLFSCMVPF